MKEQAEIIGRFVDTNYGDLISVGPTVRYKNSGYWVAHLKSDYPRFIHDDSSKNTIVKYITFKELGEVKLSDDNQVEGTPRDEVVEKLKVLLGQWRMTVEEIILRTSAPKLTNIAILKDSLNPILLVVDRFARPNAKPFTYAEIQKDTARKSMLRWLRFLTQIHILEEVNDEFREGPKFNEMYKQIGNKEELKNTIVEHVLRDYYISVRQLMGVSRFDPFLHMETCYYAPCLQAGDLLRKKQESILGTYHKWYSKQVPDYRLIPILEQLEKVELLEREGDYWVGNQKTWDVLKPQQDDIPKVIGPIKA